MSNNNYNNSSSCAFAEQLVSYLYDEADAREKLKFETHLESCSICADELSAFGFARSAVLDWRAEEFSTLPTPTFDVPFAESKESFSSAVAVNENRSWFDGFRRMFSFNSMKATTAFAVLIVSIGIIWLAFNSFDGNQIAKNEANKNAIQAAVSPTVEIVKKSEAENVIEKIDGESSASSGIINSPQQPVNREKPDSPNESVVKVSSVAPKNKADDSARNPKETNKNGTKTLPVRKKQIPNLNDAADEADETIRLADLFDELDTK